VPKFGAASEAQLVTCHPDLQRVLRKAIEVVDFSVVEGHRGEAAQNAAFAKGLSKVRYPHGKHNKNPSLAADVAPYPIDWSDRRASVERFVYVQGVIRACAHAEGVKIRQGLDWDGDLDFVEERFRDYPHVELIR
jgi:peptidoglycan LD-endopeptidase CwlK